MADVRSRYEAYREAQTRVQLAELSGQGDAGETASRLAELDDRFGDLAAGDLLDATRRELASARFEDEREDLRRLLFALERATLERATRELDAELVSRTSLRRIRIGAQQKDAGQWARLQCETPNAADRLEIQRELDRLQVDVRGLREERLVRRCERLARLGHTSHLDWFASLRPELDVAGWAGAAAALLEATESRYRDALGRAVPGVGVQPGGTQRADLLRLARRAPFDAYFPAARLLHCLNFTTQGMRLHAAGLPGVEIVAALGSGARCLALRVPEQVVLLHATRDGADACEACFDAAGRAFALAYTSSALPLERRLLGDPALGVAWGLLLGDRLCDRTWIAHGPAGERDEPFTRQARLLWLLRRRRAAALVGIELELARLGEAGDPRPLSDLYADRLSDALGCSHPAALCLLDAGAELAALDLLRGACLAAQLEEHLRQRFGLRFWEERGAGELLKELWNTGSTYSAEGIAGQLGLGTLSIDHLIECALRD